MASWNPVRIPDFILHKCFSKPALAVDPPLSRPPPLEQMRPVKRNPFSAKFLKLKTTKMPPARRASSRLCSTQIFELTGRANRLVSSRMSVLHSFGSLRRARSERKQDWDMVKISLHERTTTPNGVCCETQRIIQFPVLPCILQREDEPLQIALNDLPVMLLISPPKKIEVLNIDSNMCFDLEFLKSRLEDTLSPSVAHPFNSTCFPQIFNNGRRESLIDLHSCEMQIESPAMKWQVMWYQPVGRLNLGLSDSIIPLLRLDKSNTVQDMLQTTGITNDEVSLTKLKDMEKYRVSTPEAVQKVLGCLKTFSVVRSVSDNSLVQNVADAHFLKPDDVQDSYHFAKDISRPILPNTVLVSDGKKRERKLALNVPMPAVRSTGLRTNVLFQSLSEFRRALFTSEKCLWSMASKEVLCRAKCKRQRLLLSHQQIATLVLALSSANPTAASNAGTIWADLDTLVFSRLRALLAADHKRKSWSTSLLDMLDHVPEQVATSRQNFLTTSCQRVMTKLLKYDSPIRKWSQVHFKKILARYESRKACSQEPNETRVLKPNLLGDSDTDSDESVLDDFVLSGEELDCESDGANGLGILEEIDEDIRHNSAFKATAQVSDTVMQRKNKGDSLNLGANSARKQKVRLKVPDMLVCAAWVIEVAEQCIQTMPRGCIFLPPPLSVLPIVAIVTNTHLRDSVRDQRVAIVCETQTDVTDYIREYLRSSLGQSISVDAIKRSEHMGESAVPLPSTTARVVILDSFLFSFTVNFSLLIVFVSSDVVSAENMCSRDQAFLTNNSQWMQIPSVLVVPLDTWVGLQTYSSSVRYLSARLRYEDVLWVTANDDVYDSIAIASPRAVYLAPSHQASHLVKLLDSQAAPYLEAYKGENRKHTAQGKNKSSRLRDVNLRLVRQIMEEECNSDGSAQHQRLELLHTLRQARSFAVYDGFAVAVAYLQHSFKQANGQGRIVMSNILGDIEDEIISTTHPVVKALTRCLKEAEQRMVQDPPSLRSIHRRVRFRPLIVANSQEAVNGCLQSLKNAVNLAEATDRSIAVCSLQRLNTESKDLRGGHLPKRLEEISHLFHIVDDRYDSPSDLLLSPTVLQHVHAGRIRLITIAVDETRGRDDWWDREVSCYDELSRSIGQKELGDIVIKEPYQHQLSIASFWSVVKSSFPEWEDPVKEMAQPTAPSDPNRGVTPQTGSIPRNTDTLHLSSHVVCSSTAEVLREMLSKQVNALPKECPTLRVFIRIRPEERCTPTVTYLHSALAGSEGLQQRVLVQTLFTF